MIIIMYGNDIEQSQKQSEFHLQNYLNNVECLINTAKVMKGAKLRVNDAIKTQMLKNKNLLSSSHKNYQYQISSNNPSYVDIEEKMTQNQTFLSKFHRTQQSRSKRLRNKIPSERKSRVKVEDKISWLQANLPNKFFEDNYSNNKVQKNKIIFTSKNLQEWSNKSLNLLINEPESPVKKDHDRNQQCHFHSNSLKSSFISQKESKLKVPYSYKKKVKMGQLKNKKTQQQQRQWNSTHKVQCLEPQFLKTNCQNMKKIKILRNHTNIQMTNPQNRELRNPLLTLAKKSPTKIYRISKTLQLLKNQNLTKIQQSISLVRDKNVIIFPTYFKHDNY